jgi:hypothetical protein
MSTRRLHGDETAEGKEMTEQEWVGCRHLRSLLHDFSTKSSHRKKWLFACACCRSVWHLLSEICHQVVVTVERYADKAARPRELVAMLGDFHPHNVALGNLPGGNQAAEAVGHLGWRWRWRTLFRDEGLENRWMIYRVSRAAAEALAKSIPWEVAREAEAELLHDIRGNPFRPVVLDAAWRTSTVVSLAQAAYEERSLPSGHVDPDHLAVLADALEEAGCDNDDILSHLRGPGPHVRGCWVVDAILLKE